MAGDDQPMATESQMSSRPNSPISPLAFTETLGNGASGERKETRSSSPSHLPSELVFKVNTQVSRIKAIKALGDSVPSYSPNVSLEELNVYSAQLDEIHQAFQKDHAYFESVWPTTHRNHEYFSHDMHVTESQLCLSTRLKIGKLRQEIKSFQPQISHGSLTTSGNLPELSLPKFSGNYLEWPAYSELCTALIGSSKVAKDIEKLQYLRSSLKGEPAQKESLPLKGASLQPAWDLPSERYQNKRILIQTQLDKLFSAKQVVVKSASALTRLISTVEKAHTSLNSLGVAGKLGDHILVYHVTRNLDKATRKAWETLVESSQEYPTFQQLCEFVSEKAKALERSEVPPSQTVSSNASLKSVTKPKAQRASSHQSSQAHLSLKSYPCDCCGADHFIVMCPEFRTMTVHERRKIIASNMLCYNCCGRHSATNCKSSRRCKQCGKQHHTMLHV